MAQPGFLFGGNTPWTYEQLQRQRSIAESLRSQNSNTPQNVGEGIAAIGRALSARMRDKRATKREAELKDDFDNELNGFFNGRTFGGGYSPDAQPGGSPFSAGTYKPPTELDQMYPVGQEGPQPQPKTVSYGAADYTMGETPGMAGRIVETAESLGIDPHDLATAISYETAGTFDPTKAGPTTQWGQHRGLIQFGEPQAQQYGVNWDDPINSQLGADGAVAKYLRDTGVKPGMGLMDIYSAINAGGVGRYDRSDANNGGAPGTVADKVNNQMEGHRKKAAALLGGSYQPSTGGGAGGQRMAQADMGGIEKIARLLGNPMISDGQKMVLQALLQKEMQGMQTPDPMQAIELERAQLELEQMRNPQPKATDDIREYEFAQRQGFDGTFQDFMMETRRAGASQTNVNVGGQQNPMPGLSSLGPGMTYLYNPDGTVQMDEQGRPMASPVAGTDADRERKSSEDSKNVARENKITSSNIVKQEIGQVIAMLEGGRNQPITGISGALAAQIKGSEAADARAAMETIKANIGFDRLQQMRDSSPTGGALGNVTERELSTLQAVLGNLEFNQSKPQLLRNLQRLDEIYSGILEKAARTGDGTFVPRDDGALEPPPTENSGEVPASFADRYSSTAEKNGLTVEELWDAWPNKESFK